MKSKSLQIEIAVFMIMQEENRLFWYDQHPKIAAHFEDLFLELTNDWRKV